MFRCSIFLYLVCIIIFILFWHIYYTVYRKPIRTFLLFTCDYWQVYVYEICSTLREPHPAAETRGTSRKTNIWSARSFCRINFTYLLTPRCRVLLEKLTGLQPLKKFSAFHGTPMFITALTSVRHLSPEQASRMRVFLNKVFLQGGVVSTSPNFYREGLLAPRPISTGRGC
jgi:hypothetical protein